MTARLLWLSVVALLVTVTGSCAVAQTVDAAIDCHGICERYASCFDSTYDVSACASRCRSASGRPDFRRRADMCNACISQRSCVAATFACATECVSVVP